MNKYSDPGRKFTLQLPIPLLELNFGLDVDC